MHTYSPRRKVEYYHIAQLLGPVNPSLNLQERKLGITRAYLSMGIKTL